MRLTLRSPDCAASTALATPDATIYKWKAKFGGMDVSEAKRMKALEDENTRRRLADAMLDNAALKDLLGKKCFPRGQAKSCRGSRWHSQDERTAGV